MNVLETAIGWLALPQCISCGSEGDPLCEICATAEIVPYGERCGICGALSPGSRTCTRCRRRGGPRHIYITTDYEGTAQRMLREYKFRHLRAMSLPISRLMVDTLQFFTQADYLVAPVPTATTRRRERGFDHTALLARRIAGEIGASYNPALGRLGQARQVGAKRAHRLSQQKENYYVRRSDSVKGRQILLIDDVITTGATLSAAAKALRKAGARRVDALIFAKSL